MAAAAAAVNSRSKRVARKGQEDERPVSWARHRDLKLLVGCSGQLLRIPTADSRIHEERRSAHIPSHEIKIREDPRNTGPVSRRAWPGSGEGLEREGSQGAADGTRRSWRLVGKQQRAGALAFQCPPSAWGAAVGERPGRADMVDMVDAVDTLLPLPSSMPGRVLRQRNRASG